MKKGFTLAELLAVIVILGIIALITVPIVTKTLADYKVRLCNDQVSNIKEAARMWGSDHLLALPEEDGQTMEITLASLQAESYIGSEIKDPSKSNTFISPETTITIERVNRKIKYTVNYTCGA